MGLEFVDEEMTACDYVWLEVLFPNNKDPSAFPFEDAPEEETLLPKISSSNKFPTSFFAGVGAGLVGESFLGVGFVVVPGLFNFGAILWKGFFDYSNLGYCVLSFKLAPNPYLSPLDLSYFKNLSLYLSSVDF